jgi:hypothetical protein
MKRHFKDIALFIFLILFSRDNYCQSLNQFEVFYSPTFSNIKLGESNAIVEDKMGFRYDIGLNYTRNFGRKIELGAGIRLSKMGYNYSGYYDIRHLNTLDFRIYDNFLEFPLLVGYKLLNDSRNEFLFNLNLINQILISSETDVKQDGYENFEDKRKLKELKDQGLSIYNIAIQLGCTYKRNLGNKFFCNISPSFKYSLLVMNNVHNWNIGIGLGLGYKF